MSSHNDPVKLLEAIVRLQPELSQLSDANYPQFLEELNHLLQEIDEHLRDMLNSYPMIRDRVQEADNWSEGETFFLAGHGLYGDPITPRPDLIYICNIGPHYVEASRIMKRDVIGRPLCPQHYKAMKLSP